MSAWELRLFDRFELLLGNGVTAPLSTRKDRMLLAYLALHAGQPQPRDRLAGLLWGDRGEAQARDSLRQSIAAIRQALRRSGADPIAADRTSIALQVGPEEVDVIAFETWAKEPASWDKAAALYRGDLLPEADGLTQEFDTWLKGERARLAALAAKLAEDISIQTKNSDAGLQLARRLFQNDPLNEPACRALMRLMAQTGNRSEATRAYATCRDALKEELDAAPDPATETLHREILAGLPQSALAASPGPSDQPPEEKPSIAVLPFSNLSGDPRLDPFCEGIAEDVITGLGRFRLLFVIDRYSSSAVLKYAVDVAEIGRRLGAAHLVQGSLQKSGDRVRITVRLVEAQSRAQLWGDVFERELSELVALPDAITSAIVSQLHSRVEQTLLERSRRKPSLAAYECLLRGIRHLRGYAPDDNDRAIDYFQKAIDLDPDYALAVAYRGFADVVKHNYDLAPRDVLVNARNMVASAIRLDNQEARCHWLLGIIVGYMGDLEAEATHYQRAIELNPNDANFWATYGAVTTALGRSDEGIALMKKAMRLNPFPPEWYWITLGNALYFAKRYEEALAAYRNKEDPGYWLWARIAASCGQLGRESEAKAAAAEVLRLKPDFSLTGIRRGGWRESYHALLQDGLRKAGLPE